MPMAVLLSCSVITELKLNFLKVSLDLAIQKVQALLVVLADAPYLSVPRDQLVRILVENKETLRLVQYT